MAALDVDPGRAGAAGPDRALAVYGVRTNEIVARTGLSSRR